MLIYFFLTFSFAKIINYYSTKTTSLKTYGQTVTFTTKHLFCK